MKQAVKYVALLRRLLGPVPAAPAADPVVRTWRDAPPALIAKPVVRDGRPLSGGEAP